MKFSWAIAIGLIILCSVKYAPASPIISWTDDKLMEKSDLVILATFVESKDELGGPAGKLPMITMTTTFVVDASMKGQIESASEVVKSAAGKTRRKIKLRHYRYVDPKSQTTVVDAPQLVRFDGQSGQYVLFLKRGGSHESPFEPTTGHYNPTFSVRLVVPYSDPPALKTAEPTAEKN